VNRRFFKNWRLIPAGTACTGQTGIPDRSDLSMQADSPVSRNKSHLELEPITNLGYVSCRVFLTKETSPYTQVEHTQVDRAEAQFKLKNYKCKVSKSNRNKDDAMKTR